MNLVAFPLVDVWAGDPWALKRGWSREGKGVEEVEKNSRYNKCEVVSAPSFSQLFIVASQADHLSPISHPLLFPLTRIKVPEFIGTFVENIGNQLTALRRSLCLSKSSLFCNKKFCKLCKGYLRSILIYSDEIIVQLTYGHAPTLKSNMLCLF